MAELLKEHIGWVIALFGVFWGLFQYVINSAAAAREQIRFGAIRARDEMESFDKDLSVKAALRMIDWESSYVDIYCDSSTPKVFVDERVFCSSLRHYLRPDLLSLKSNDETAAIEPSSDDVQSPRLRGFSKDEQAIRDVFDVFLGRLERIESLVRHQVVPIGAFQDYFSYWLDILDENGSMKESMSHFSDRKRRVFWSYVRGYQFKGVIRLFGMYGKTKDHPRYWFLFTDPRHRAAASPAAAPVEKHAWSR